MKTLVNVARYHTVDRLIYFGLPWAIMAFSFLVNLAISALAPVGPNGNYTGGLVTIYIFLLLAGALSMTRELPFGLMLGVSRRAYYLGTALLVGVLGVVYGLALTVLQAIERASGGWGVSLHFFRVPWIMNGPWYQTWVTSFVLLVLFFLYGMWYGKKSTSSTNDVTQVWYHGPFMIHGTRKKCKDTPQPPLARSIACSTVSARPYTTPSTPTSRAVPR